MTVFRLCFYCLLLQLPAYSFAGMMGGACGYEVVYGTARIVEQTNGTMLARFVAEKRQSAGNSLVMPRFLKISIQQPVAGGIGSIYPAELSVIIKGSCSPGGARLLSTEVYSGGVFIKLGNEGRISEADQGKLSQIARVFKKLAPRWPQLQLEVFGQTSSQGTQEYNLNLAAHHARQIAQQMEQKGVPASKIKTSSSGEGPCHRAIFFDNAHQHGVCLSFSLTGTELEKNEERH